MATVSIENDQVRIELLGQAQRMFIYTVKASGRAFAVAGPVLEIDSKPCPLSVTSLAAVGRPAKVGDGCMEYRFCGRLDRDPAMSLEMILRLADGSPILRFSYVLSSAQSRPMTKKAAHDELTYMGVSLAGLAQVTEVRLGDFNQAAHSYCPSERAIEDRQFEDELAAIGPILLAGDARHSLLLAYEHGSTVPDAFLQFCLTRDRGAALRAVKGNYWAGRIIDKDHPFQTLWLQIAAVEGTQDQLTRAFRHYVLHHLSPNAETRKPYIFYNTWAYQERNKWWNNAKYLDSMHQQRILDEIDACHRMGVDVFVLDTGWYAKTGDWLPNLQRFPDGLKTVKERLDSYGMKLGLWFGPTHAAVSSEILKRHAADVMSWQGQQRPPHEVWETEASQNLCLVSPYGDAFADTLIRLCKEIGVTYFKWDALGQYGCDDPGHAHGLQSNANQERADCYAFELVRSMSHIVDRLCKACPQAIVDFDVTEAGRCMGLAFLAAGKYFLINNGPYYQNYDVPIKDEWSNLFVYPGQARSWICRTPLPYDRWIPSVLLLTHYLPDEGPESQTVNIASLILGQNGIWGDPLTVSPAGVELIGKLLGLYKQVRDDITESFPVVTGVPGGSPEIHEKLLAKTGRGAVCAFATAPGTYTYVTAAVPNRAHHASDGAKVTFDARGRAKIELTFQTPGAKIVFFGVK